MKAEKGLHGYLRVCIGMFVMLAGVFWGSGCSPEGHNAAERNQNVLREWTEKQNWLKYSDGGTVVVEGDYVIGVGVVASSSGHEAERARMLAMQAVAEKTGQARLPRLVTVFNARKELGGKKKHIVVLGARVNGK